MNTLANERCSTPSASQTVCEVLDNAARTAFHGTVASGRTMNCFRLGVATSSGLGGWRDGAFWCLAVRPDAPYRVVV